MKAKKFSMCGSLWISPTAMIPPDLAAITGKYVQYLREYGWTVAYGLPFIALLVSIARKKKGDKLNA